MSSINLFSAIAFLVVGTGRALTHITHSGHAPFPPPPAASPNDDQSTSEEEEDSDRPSTNQRPANWVNNRRAYKSPENFNKNRKGGGSAGRVDQLVGRRLVGNDVNGKILDSGVRRMLGPPESQGSRRSSGSVGDVRRSTEVTKSRKVTKVTRRGQKVMRGHKVMREVTRSREVTRITRSRKVARVTEVMKGYQGQGEVKGRS